MRADRLVYLIMLLQARGRSTAAELAEELEVSERTIYRDMDALSAAGVPVYAERGPGGGCALLEDYRTTLTGLTQGEARALLMLSIPDPLNELGMGAELKTALLKVAVALPAVGRSERENLRDRIHLDSTAWFQQKQPLPQLHLLRRALVESRVLVLTMAYRAGVEVELVRPAAPYGLVAKTNVWHLVWSDGCRVRVDPVSHIREARLTEEVFDRPADFDLAAFWDAWCERRVKNRSSYPVIAQVAVGFFPVLVREFGDRVQQRAEPTDTEGWVPVTLYFDTLFEARDRILGYGRAVKVIEPRALRLSLMDFAAQVSALYTTHDRALDRTTVPT